MTVHGPYVSNCLYLTICCLQRSERHVDWAWRKSPPSRWGREISVFTCLNVGRFFCLMSSGRSRQSARNVSVNIWRRTPRSYPAIWHACLSRCPFTSLQTQDDRWDLAFLLNSNLCRVSLSHVPWSPLMSSVLCWLLYFSCEWRSYHNYFFHVLMHSFVVDTPHHITPLIQQSQKAMPGKSVRFPGIYTCGTA